MVILDQIKYILYNRLNNGPLIYQALIVGAPKCYFIWEKSFVDVTKLRLKLRFLRWEIILDYPVGVEMESHTSLCETVEKVGHTEGKCCADRGRNWGDEAISQGMAAATSSWKKKVLVPP